MTQLGNAAHDLADRLAEREREHALARVQAAARGQLQPSGRLFCDCGAEISEARRRAHPAATDCIDCATFAERQQRRRA